MIGWSSIKNCVGTAAIVFLLAACQSFRGTSPHAAAPAASGRVSGSEVIPEAATRMSLRPDQVFLRGELIEPSASPAYPDGLAALGLPRQVVCVRFVVGKDGAVSDIAPEIRLPDCPDLGAEQAPFFAAVVNAVSQWEFFSNQVCTFPPGTPAEQRCSGKGVDVQPVAISLIYRFEFSLRDGTGVVERSAP